jgi:hypothetical protein
MNTKLVLIGQLQNKIEGENKEGKKYLTLQFLNNRNGRLQVIDVKVDSEDIGKFEKAEVGKEVKILVDVSTFKDKIYYKAVDLVK